MAEGSPRQGWAGVSARSNLTELDVRHSSYYQALIKQLSRTALHQTSLTGVLREARGAFPDVVLQLLKLMGFSRELPEAIIREEAYDFSVELHPLLYEWYFNKPSTRLIAEVAASAASSWTCIGTPTIAHELSKHSGYVRLIDADPAVATRFPSLLNIQSLHISEVGDQIPAEKTMVAIIDPPWYAPDVLRWLAVAQRLVENGGTIIAPIFPEMTRPSAWTDREHVLGAASALGDVELHPKVVCYSSPIFELETFRALGISDPGDWRVADLLVIRNVRGHIAPRPETNLRLADRGWTTFTIGRQVIKLRDAPTGSHEFEELLPIDGCPNNTLTTVSERDPRRPLIGVWTSRNRVAQVLDRRTVGVWLKALEDPYARIEILASPPDSASFRLLVDVVGLEL